VPQIEITRILCTTLLTQVVYLLKRVQQQEDLVAAYMEDYKGTGQFIDDSVNELLDI
jgi:hypothetical protein